MRGVGTDGPTMIFLGEAVQRRFFGNFQDKAIDCWDANAASSDIVAGGADGNCRYGSATKNINLMT